MIVSYAFWRSRRGARVMGRVFPSPICRYYPDGTPPCPPYMPGCNTKITQANFDSVLLFKMGKFYEMYEMDAHVGVEHLGLLYMKGDQPHCGFLAR